MESRHPIPVDVALYRGGLIRRQGYERGRVEGRAEARYGMVRRMLLKRGIEVSDGFPDGLPAECDDDSLIAAALACESEVDFLNRLRDGSPRS